MHQFKDEEAMKEEDIPTEMEGPETDLHVCQHSSDVFVGPAVKGVS